MYIHKLVITIPGSEVRSSFSYSLMPTASDIFLRDFSVDRKQPKRKKIYIPFCWRYLICGLNRFLASIKLTHYLLDYEDFLIGKYYALIYTQLCVQTMHTSNEVEIRRPIWIYMDIQGCNWEESVVGEREREINKSWNKM